MKFKVGFLLPLAAAAALAMPSSAFAATAGAGVVTGHVTVTPGIPTTGCAATTYVFDSTVLVGAVVTGGGNYAGTINASASGGSVTGTTLCPGGGENAAEAAGNVNVDSLTPGTGVGTFNCPNAPALAGSFKRFGPLVLVTGLSGTCNNQTITTTVVALFIPTNPGNASQTNATFAGVFAIS